MPFVAFVVCCFAECIISVYSFPEYFFPRIIFFLGDLFLLLQFVAVIVLLVAKEKKASLYSFLALLVSLLAVFVVGYFTLFMNGTRDHFGARHPIPDDMDYSLPDEKGIVPSETDSTSWILLQEATQPGLYDYSVALPAVGSGAVGIDAYEAVSSFRLFFGEDHKDIRHKLSGHNAFGIVAAGNAMLSEGIWGEPYAVRIEVTFTPEGSKEKRLMVSKIYKLEGWMR